ncbi:FAD-binding protein [Streptomyces sp. NPDC008139]|uniref:FAD-binding oxidoreductase n=1 Tax=Streptomyces sp. NPDC008139 TaxID=3364814 RepID=UPI0036E6FC40
MISRRKVLGAGATAVALSGLGATAGFAGSGAPWSQLRAHLQGRLVLPTDSGYTTAKQLDLQQFDVINPQAVAYCVSAADVALTLKFAQDNCIPFAVRSGGHSGGGYSTSTGLVIDVSGLNSISVGQNTVTVGTGVQGVDAIDALAPHGKAIIGGYCPTVAVGGFYQGGGLGVLTRSYGVGSDRIASAKVVLANGDVVTASPTQNRDLYWGIRGGGGGNFGVVTSYDITTVDVSQLAVVNLNWTFDKAADVLDGYARWSVNAPRTLSGGAFLQLFDASPGAPVNVMVFVASTGTTAELTSEVARLVALTGAPASQTPASVVPYQPLMMGFFRCAADVTACHRADTTPGGTLPRSAFGLQRSRFFNRLPSRSVWDNAAALFETLRVPGQAHLMEVLPLGGAVRDLRRTDTAFVHRDALFTVNFLVDIGSPDAADSAGRAAGQAFVDNGFRVIDRQSSGETYQNFIDPELPDWRQAYYAENYPRLSAVKHRYDPHGAFRFAQSIR